MNETNIGGLRQPATSAEPITPALAQPKAGDPAPSAITPLSAEQMKKLIDEAVEVRVREALEDSELKKADIVEEDQQFTTFEKKLEVHGVDLDKKLGGRFHLRWFNDDGDRIHRAMAMGYALVTRDEIGLNDSKLTPLNQDLGENIAVYVGRQEGGNAMRAFLMKIPKELYEKRYAAEQRHNDMIEDAIRRGGMGTALANKGYAGTDGGTVRIGYNPKAGMQRVPKPT